MWFRLLAEDVTDTAKEGNSTGTYILLAVAVVVLIAMFAWSSYSNKKRQKQMQEQMNGIEPGYRIKTIGGICGTVIEVNREENTFVLETGTQEQKSYMKFDMQAIYQAEAPQDAVSEEPVSTEASEEPVPTETAEEPVLTEAAETEQTPSEE